MRIDTHHHILPMLWVEIFKNITHGIQLPRGLALPPWSVNMSRSMMAQNDIGVAIVSLSAPALSIIPDAKAAASTCRLVNEYSASIHNSDPTHFGFFASVPPLTDTAAAVAEIQYSFDTLDADGVTLFTSYNETYLGDPYFEPIWAELDKRAAVVFIHPSQNLKQTSVSPSLQPSIVDFTHETTRAATDLISRGTLRKYQRVRVILSHGGGTLPYVATRAGGLMEAYGLGNLTASEFLHQARRFYFDLALASFEYPLDLLLRFADPERILYGSDYPFISTSLIAKQVRNFDAYAMNEQKREKILHQNAQKLFPRFSGC